MESQATPCSQRFTLIDRKAPRVQLSDLKIVCVIADLGLGGAQKNLLAVAEWLSHEGCSVSLITLRRVSQELHSVQDSIRRDNGSSLVPFRWYKVFELLERLRDLRRRVMRFAPDLVITFGDTTNVLTLIACMGLRLKVVVSERVDPRSHPIPLRFRLLRRLLYPGATRVAMVGKDSADWARKLWPRWRVYWLPNAVTPAKEAIGPLSPTETVIVGAGRFVKQKGFDLLIRAFALIAPRIPHCRVCLYGDGPEHRSLVQLAERLGVASRVELIPPTVGTNWLRGSGRIFVLPSLYEGFPNALAEAMAQGYATVSFDCPGGPSMLVDHGKNGLLVPTGDIEALAIAIEQLMTDDALRMRLGLAAKEVVHQYSPARVKELWIRLIQGCITEV